MPQRREDAAQPETDDDCGQEQGNFPAPGSEGRTAELAAATVAAAPSMGGVETAQDVSDAELVTAVVQDATSEPVAPVDQRRDRTGQPEPSWGGTSALSMAEARLLVTGEDPEAQK